MSLLYVKDHIWFCGYFNKFYKVLKTLSAVFPKTILQHQSNKMNCISMGKRGHFKKSTKLFLFMCSFPF